MTDLLKSLEFDKDKSMTLPDYGRCSSNYSLNRSKLMESIDSEKIKKPFIQAHVDANRELKTQLRNNIELLFKSSNLVSQIMFFPLKVLRWQCQINSESTRYHLLPFTLFPVTYNLICNSGLTMWKGCFSMAAYSGIKIIFESVFSEVTDIEKNLEDIKKAEKLHGHVALKFISNALTTPIFSAVIFESVQSGISYENLGLADLMRETWNRITGYKYNYRTRLIPIWSLVLPTSFYFAGIHILSFGLEKAFYPILKTVNRLLYDRRNFYGADEVEEEVIDEPYIKSASQIASQIGALVVLYPIETVINRLIVQGTRTIIDNTDNGVGVIPINSRYDGFWDCLQTINDVEGYAGFYKGFGSLILETVLCVILLKTAKAVAIRIYDSEWITKSDKNNIKNLMSPNNNYITNQSQANL